MNTITLHIAVDLSLYMSSYQAMPGIALLNNYYSLKDMISDIFIFTPHPGETEHFYDAVNTVVPATIGLDLLNIETLLYKLFNDLDNLLICNLGKKYELVTYFLKGWLSDTTAVFELEANENINNRFTANIPYFSF